MNYLLDWSERTCLSQFFYLRQNQKDFVLPIPPNLERYREVLGLSITLVMHGHNHNSEFEFSMSLLGLK